MPKSIYHRHLTQAKTPADTCISVIHTPVGRDARDAIATMRTWASIGHSELFYQYRAEAIAAMRAMEDRLNRPHRTQRHNVPLRYYNPQTPLGALL